MHQHLDTSLTSSEEQLLVNMIGKRFDKFRCDEFRFTPSVYGTLGIFIDGQAYELTNFQVVQDPYFGYREEVSELRLKTIEEKSLKSGLDNVIQHDRLVGDTIRDILLYQDLETMTKNGTFFFDHRYTRAIVFCFEGHQIAFEGGTEWNEQIYIARGADASTEIGTPDDFLDESPDYEETVTREIVSIKKKYGLT